MQFIARVEFELDYLGSTHKRASLEIFKLDSTWLDYILTRGQSFTHFKQSLFVSCETI